MEDLETFLNFIKSAWKLYDSASKYLPKNVRRMDNWLDVQ